MRLLKVNILSKFRGLPEPPASSYSFDNVELSEDKIEPICLVGLNGSGKSNLLEVICEIFYYLETYIQQEGKPAKQFSTNFAFEISYNLDITYNIAQGYIWEDFDGLTFNDLQNPVIKFRKEPGGLPFMTISNGKNKESNPTIDYLKFLLPIHVIAYSSGQNELISNPYIKSAYRYFEFLDKKQFKEGNDELPLSRLISFDYDTSQFASVCNLLFTELNQASILIKELKLDQDSPLDSFCLTIRYKNYRNKPIIFPSTLQVSISDLKSCATAFEENDTELILAYKVDSETRRAFQRKFGSALSLFRAFYFLNLLNIHLHGTDTRNRIKNAPSLTYDNLSHLIPVPPRNKLIFSMDKIRLRKQGTNELIKYRNLSDGEHQLMHVLGSIMLLNTSGSILLYDEPETHFNPEWRSQLITLINKTTKERNEEDKIRKQEILITSHSPFIVSDCRRERVFIFDKGKSVNPKINTFGTSVNIITEEVFKKSESISGMPLQEIKDIKSLSLKTLEDIQKAKEASRKLGESVEKVLLFRELILRENEIKNQDDKEL